MRTINGGWGGDGIHFFFVRLLVKFAQVDIHQVEPKDISGIDSIEDLEGEITTGLDAAYFRSPSFNLFTNVFITKTIQLQPPPPSTIETINQTNFVYYSEQRITFIQKNDNYNDKTFKTLPIVNLKIYSSTPDLEDIASLELVDPSLDVTEPTSSWWEKSEINLSSRSSTSSQELILISPSQVYLYTLLVCLFVCNH